MINKHAVLLLVISLMIVFNANCQTNKDFFFTTKNYQDNVSTYDISTINQGERLAAVSLQGLANRDTAKIYLLETFTGHLFEIYQNKGLISDVKKYNDIYTLLGDFKRYFTGAVVYDPEKTFIINLASNIAGVEDRIIISPEMITGFKKHTGYSDIKDLRQYNFKNIADAYIWYEENIYPSQTDKILAVANDGYMHDVYRDYLIEFRIPTFWLPGKSDEDYNTVYENRIKGLFNQTPPNIPILGFWPDDNENGYTEYDGVKLAGFYGKFTVVNTWVGNYSFHSAFNDNYIYSQKKVRSKEFRQYNPSKKYVALIMIESGDSPGYMQFGFENRQWGDPYRGKVPISYGINPSMRMLLPAYTHYLYETATENDFFFCSISGAGYCYPFEGYGTLTYGRDQVLKDYFAITSQNMALLDLDMMGLYTHPNTVNGRWTDNDQQLFDDYIKPMDNLKSLISGMHRNGYSAKNANNYYPYQDRVVTVHHTLTFWPFQNWTYDNSLFDDLAVSFLENEITTYGQDGNFIQAMFYSWIYGPRRLKKLVNKMESYGYEFLTLNEFDYLYRYSQEILTGSNEIKNEDFISIKAYPNPTNDTLFFTREVDGGIEIFDISGNLIQRIKNFKGSSIPLNEIPNGQYLIKIKSKTKGKTYSNYTVNLQIIK